MTNEEAIARLKFLKLDDPIKQAYNEISNEAVQGVVELTDICISAVEKQMPKSVDRDGGTWCPECHYIVNEDNDDYCPSCGQHLLWEDEE